MPIESEDGDLTSGRCAAGRTDHAEYEVTGEVISLIPLRNRRTNLTGSADVITEAMTRYRCGDVGIGMSEY